MTTTTQTDVLPSPDERAKAIIRNYTLLAMGTGAIPFPSASLAIVTENALMIGHIAACFGVPVSVDTVAASLGTVGLLNLGGRALFVEGMRVLNTLGGGLASFAVSALGATTAGVQTWAIGHLALEIARRGGVPVGHAEAAAVIKAAKASFDPETLRREREAA
jgi:uncharacterized protein (DUF697 family)